MLGDIAILVLVFVGGFFAGKRFDTLGAALRAARSKVEGWLK
jgi:hypothetical protein